MDISDRITIRVLEDSDVDKFLPLRLRALEESPHSFGADHTEWLELPPEEVLRRMQRRADAFVLGAFDRHDLNLLGIAGCRRRTGIKLAHTAEIWGVYVDEHHRGKGIARALMLDALRQVRLMDGVDRVVLTVVTTNQHAARLYETLGFKSYGREPRALRVNGNYFDEEMMVLDLAARD